MGSYCSRGGWVGGAVAVCVWLLQRCEFGCLSSAAVGVGGSGGLEACSGVSLAVVRVGL